MKKTDKGKKQDKCPGQDNFGDHCDMLTDECEANASVASSLAPTTINGVILDFKAALTKLSDRV